MNGEMITAGLRSRGRGFSLVEVLVAFTVMALVIGAIFQILGTGLRSVDTSGEYSRAVLLAQSKLDELTGGQVLLGDEERGEFDGRFQWVSRVDPYLEDDAGDSLPAVPLLATVRVSWAAGPAERSVSLSSVVLGSEP